jgi:gamma-tubulin complex component 2
MASLRKDDSSAISRVAAARRRQRVVPSSSREVHFSETLKQQQDLHEDYHDELGRHRPRVASSTAGAPGPRRTSPSPASHRSSSPKSSDGGSRLLERSQEVAEEAASVLASARKQQRPQPPAPPPVRRITQEEEAPLVVTPRLVVRPQERVAEKVAPEYQPLGPEPSYLRPPPSLKNSNNERVPEKVPTEHRRPEPSSLRQPSTLKNSNNERIPERVPEKVPTEHRRPEPSYLRPPPSLRNSNNDRVPAKEPTEHRRPEPLPPSLKSNAPEKINNENKANQIAAEEATTKTTQSEDEAPPEQPLDQLPPTVEDLEDVTVLNPFIDAACIPDLSTVMLRSTATLRTLKFVLDGDESVDPNTVQDHNGSSTIMGGFGLGQQDELLTLSILESHMNPTTANTSTVLCYGDCVALQSLSTTTRSPVLGVRRRHSDSSTRVGFFETVVSPAEQWVVLRADPPHAVRLGRDQPKLRGPTGPVQVGDPIVLRNYQTGDILAIQDSNSDQPNSSRDGNELRLVADSHDAHRIRHDETADATLLGRLQRHDRLVPVEAETFQLLPPTVPPVPLWMVRRGGIRNRLCSRVYLQGSYYLLQSESQDSRSTPRPGTTRVGAGDDIEEFRVHIESIGRDDIEKPSGQEQVLLDEILGSFLGLEGDYIRARSESGGMDDLCFFLDNPRERSFDPILRRLVEDLLPLSTAYAKVRHFVAMRLPGYEYGCVMHAFCGHLDKLLHDYVSFIASLETLYRQGKEDLSLCSLQVQIKPTLNVMLVLERSVEAVATKKGGALLNALRALKRETYEGDGLAETILQELLEASAGPYLKILGEWLEHGVLTDPYSEFMVHRSDERTPWESRYEISTNHVLNGFFSTKLTVKRVLATGRYWNALQACNKTRLSGEEGKSSELAQPQTLQYRDSSSTVASFIQVNYQKASQALVGLLLGTFDLMGSLRLMKRYFLLDHGDFFLYFLDAAEDELRKDLSTISRGRIQHWLDASIQYSERHMEDGYLPNSPSKSRRDDGQQLTPTGLRCRFAPESLTDYLDELHAARGGIDTQEPWTPLRHAYGGASKETLTGLDAFMVDFASIPFPVSLILSQRALDCYQLLFRHLFFAKHVERRLVGVWKDHQGMKELQSLRGSMGSTFLLRQRMLHFMQNLIYYMMLEVIEPQWSELEHSIGFPSAGEDQTIDDISEAHMQFLHRALEACLLTNRNLARALTKLMNTCLLFSDEMNLFMKATKLQNDRDSVADEKQKVAQRNLNDRRGSMRLSVDRKVLEKSMLSSRLERKKRIHRQTGRVEREISGESYPRMISRYDQVFSDDLREFMAQLTHSDDLYHSQKVNLCIRLDYNGYVTRAMGLATNV